MDTTRAQEVREKGFVDLLNLTVHRGPGHVAILYDLAVEPDHVLVVHGGNQAYRVTLS